LTRHRSNGHCEVRSLNHRVKCDYSVQRIVTYSLNNTTAFYFVTEYSNIAVFVRLGLCMSQCIRTLSGLDQFRN